MTPNEWSVPQLEEPEQGTVLQDDTGRVWVRGETRWSTPGQAFNPPTWTELLSRVTRLRRLVPAEPDNTPPPCQCGGTGPQGLRDAANCPAHELRPSPDLSTDGDGLDLVTHLREEYRTLRDEYDAMRGSLASILGLGTTEDDVIVESVRYLQEHR